MSRARTGSIVKRKDRPGLWARVSYVDENSKVKATWKKVENRSEGQRVIKEMLRKIDDHGARIIEGERMTFGQLADIYEEQKLVEPVYKGETRISGMRSWKHQRYYL